MLRPAIVIVGAFPPVLHKLENDLEQKYSDHFRIIGVNAGQQALNQLKQMNLHNEPVALLLADEQMPEMNGSEFLKEAQDLHPSRGRTRQGPSRKHHDRQ
jgi:thioredoxin reductase (NADPH)